MWPRTGNTYTVAETQTQVASDTEARSVLIDALATTNDSAAQLPIRTDSLPNQSTAYDSADLPRDITNSIRHRADIQSGTNIYPYIFNKTPPGAIHVDIVVVTDTGRVIAVLIGTC